MFLLQERTQRLVCRAAFLMLGLLPLLALVTWAAVVNSPGYQRSQQARWVRKLQETLGRRVTIARVSQPARTLTLMEEVALPGEFGQGPPLRVPALEVTPYRDGWMVSLSQPEFSARQLPQLWRQLDRLLRDAPVGAAPVWLHASALTLRGGDSVITLADVSCRRTVRSKVTELLVEFSLAGGEPEPRNRLAIRCPTGGASTLELTARQPLPCAVLGDALPLLSVFGSRAEFSGKLQAQFDGQNWSGRLKEAVFQKVELDGLLAACSMHVLRGEAEVRIDEARFQQPQVQVVRGHVSAGRGVVSAGLLRALERELGIAIPPRVVDGKQKFWDFTRLAFDFALADGVLELHGRCGGAFQGATMVDKEGTLLLQPERPQAPAVALIRALVPRSDVQAPATRQTQPLLDVLPVPDIRRAEPGRPTGRLRLRETPRS